MKALVCVQPLEIMVEDRPAPMRQDGQVLLRMRRAGIMRRTRPLRRAKVWAARC